MSKSSVNEKSKDTPKEAVAEEEDAEGEEDEDEILSALDSELSVEGSQDQKLEVWTNDLTFTPLQWDSELTRTSPVVSQEPSLDAICTHLYKESDSNLFPDDTIDFKPVVDPGIEAYMNKDEKEQLDGWLGYLDECRKYHLSPIGPVHPCLDRKSVALKLDQYGTNNLHVEQILRAIQSMEPPVNLPEIDFRNNPIGSVGCKAISDFLDLNKLIEYLDLSYCPLGELGAEYLCNGIVETKTLVCLKLAFCELGDVGGESIIQAIEENSTITELDLSGNALAARTILALGKMVKVNSVLTHLNLNWNYLHPDPDSLKEFGKGMMKNATLRWLGFAWNGLFGPLCVQNLVKSMRKAPIYYLNLEYNRLRSEELMNIITIIKRSKALEEIYLQGNYFTDADYKTILDSLLASTSMKVVSFGEHTFLSLEAARTAELLREKFPDLKIVFQGVVRNIPADEVDMKPIVIDRVRFLAMKPKGKLKRDMGHVMYWMLDDERPIVDRQEVTELVVETFGARIDNDLMQSLNDAFLYVPPEEPEDEDAPKKKKKKKKKVTTVEWHVLAKYYLDRYPTERGLPKPKPPEEGEEEEVDPKGKKGKKPPAKKK